MLNLFVSALETDRKVSLWPVFPVCFAWNANKFDFLPTIYIEFILQSHKFRKQPPNVLKKKYERTNRFQRMLSFTSARILLPFLTVSSVSKVIFLKNI